MFSTPQMILFIVLAFYLLAFSAGYLIAQRNRGPAITTLGLGRQVLTAFTFSPAELFKTLLGFLGFLVFLPLLPLLALFLIPYFSIVARVQRYREAQFAERMKLVGRALSWPEAQKRARGKHGTLVCEILSFQGRSRLWWTPDDLAAISPFPFLRSENKVRHWTEKDFSPFGEWCRERYTNEASGGALLVEEPRAKAERRIFWQEAAEAGYIEFFCGKRRAQ